MTNLAGLFTNAADIKEGVVEMLPRCVAFHTEGWSGQMWCVSDNGFPQGRIWWSAQQRKGQRDGSTHPFFRWGQGILCIFGASLTTYALHAFYSLFYVSTIVMHCEQFEKKALLHKMIVCLPPYSYNGTKEWRVSSFCELMLICDTVFRKHKKRLWFCSLFCLCEGKIIMYSQAKTVGGTWEKPKVKKRWIRHDKKQEGKKKLERRLWGSTGGGSD